MNFPDDKCDDFMLQNNINIGFTLHPFDAILFYSLYCRRFKIVILCGKKHRLAKKRKIKIDELKDERIIVFSNTPLTIDICAQYGIMPDIILNSPDMEILDNLLGSGQMAAFGLEFHGEPDPDWVMIELEDMNYTLDCNIIIRKNSFPSVAEKLFIDYTKKRLIEAET
jgi:hypothetical protein